MIGSVALLVRDYDEAVAFFTVALGFRLLEDTALGGGKRWVRVAPRGPGGTALLLARAATPEQAAQVGAQAGGRVAFFLHTDDFRADYDAFRARGVRFLEEPRAEPYGTVAVFEDLYGNRWDLLQPAAMDPPWKRFPGWNAYDPMWRMGPGEDYRHAWWAWYSRLDDGAKQAYRERHPPPEDWAGYFDGDDA